jgi:predicted membrane protein
MTRLLSLTAAGLFSLMILLDPYLLAGAPAWRIHTGLSIGMLGVAGLFMHGLHYVPRMTLTRTFFHPVTAWLLFVVGGVIAGGCTANLFC